MQVTWALSPCSQLCMWLDQCLKLLPLWLLCNNGLESGTESWNKFSSPTLYLVVIFITAKKRKRNSALCISTTFPIIKFLSNVCLNVIIYCPSTLNTSGMKIAHFNTLGGMEIIVSALNSGGIKTSLGYKETLCCKKVDISIKIGSQLPHAYSLLWLCISDWVRAWMDE